MEKKGASRWKKKLTNQNHDIHHGNITEYIYIYNIYCIYIIMA